MRFWSEPYSADAGWCAQELKSRPDPRSTAFRRGRPQRNITSGNLADRGVLEAEPTVSGQMVEGLLFLLKDDVFSVGKQNDCCSNASPRTAIAYSVDRAAVDGQRGSYVFCHDLRRNIFNMNPIIPSNRS